MFRSGMSLYLPARIARLSSSGRRIFDLPVMSRTDIPDRCWPFCLSYLDMIPKHEDQKSAAGRALNKRAPPAQRNLSSSVTEMEIQFLGTVSSQPTPTRAHTSLALRLDGEIWIFDAGESCQLQLTKSSLKAGKVTTIFLTHLHGDHVFGLGPLVCSLAQSFKDTSVASEKDEKVSSMDDAPVQIEIYGPLGTRMYLRSQLRYSYSFTTTRWRVHELILPGEEAVILDTSMPHPCEALGSNIHSKEVDGCTVFQDFMVEDEHRRKHPSITMHAAPIRHTVPTLGFVLQERALQGNIPPSYVQQLKAAQLPLSLLKDIKDGVPLLLPNGTTLHPPTELPGRKLCILGDTCDPSNIASLARNVDVLIHEATNAHLASDEGKKSTDTYESVEITTISHGHSTPQMAGRFAKMINAKSLLLNHFSGRYKGDSQPESMKIMNEIKDLASVEVPGRHVYTARDWSSFILSAAKKLTYKGTGQ